MTDILKYWIALNMVEDVGKKTFALLIDKFGSPQNVFNASQEELSRIKRITPKIISDIKTILDSERLKKELDLIEKNYIEIVTLKDKNYPQNLEEIPSPPPVLYVKGELKSEDIMSLSVVGTRTPSEYGRRMTKEITEKLVKYGITIVSGLAYGIDSVAHRSTLDNGGRTIAVMGTGINMIYPAKNTDLAKEIIKNGALISEFPMSVQPEKKNFPIRNVTIAGLSLGTLVCEAPAESGALITGNLALDLGREIFSIPGNALDPRYAGTNNLIKKGAKLVTSVDDILEELSGRFSSYFKAIKFYEKRKERTPDILDGQKEILNILTFEEQHLDALAIKLKKPVEKISSELFQLELLELVKQLPGKMYIRLKE
ncbi:DNA-processing protein DprA [bacterium]|nr:DNA-processing protein DprA [bacterium]